MAVPITYETALTELASLSSAAGAEASAIAGAYTAFDIEVASLASAINALASRLASMDTRVAYVKTNFGTAL